jgi:hypothetical protein
MPTGFAEVPVQGDPNGSAIRLGGGQLSSGTIPFAVAATTFHRYSQGTQSLVPGPYVASTVIVLQNPSDAPKVLSAFRSAAAMAATWSQPVPVPPGPAGVDTFTSSALSFPKIGDDTFAVRLTDVFHSAVLGTDINEPSADYVLWRTGPVVSIILGSNVTTQTYVESAQTKVTSILTTCPRPPKAKKKSKK